MKRAFKIVPIIIGFVIFAVFLLLFSKPLQNVFIKAENKAPADVSVSEISDNSAKILWTTPQELQGVIEYGLSPTDLNYFAPEISKVTSHSVDLTLLVPNTTYYFQIRIGDQKFDNSGVPWTFATKATGGETSSDTLQNSVNTLPKSDITPASSVEIPDTDSSDAIINCSDSDCQKIKSNLGRGCNTSDYLKCLRKSAQ